jgi:neutral ceramidase
VGAGRYDITGPASEVGMMGYARLGQRTGGIHTRLWARAFVVANPCTGRRVALVVADLLDVSQAVRQQVLERLRRDLGGLYTERNVMLAATHTHSGPGGYSHYALYNLHMFGFDPQAFEAVVDGIHRALLRAHAALAPGAARLAAGELAGAGINRSPLAYGQNPPGERARWGGDVDTRMVLLRLDRADGRPAGAVSWFPVHATSMGNDNALISGDNKGRASQLLERHLGVRAPLPGAFVGAFAQGAHGDVSPNVLGGTRGLGRDDVESTELSARAQSGRALALLEEAAPLPGGPDGEGPAVDFRHAHVSFDRVRVGADFGGGRERHTCPAAVGASMFAGAEDGPAVGREGLACSAGAGAGLACALLTTDCQAEKPVLIEMGTMWPHPWSPEVLPVQLLRVGPLAVVGVPFEVTTMAGRRLRETVQAELAGAGVREVVVASLANAYAGYVTTREEYALQHYEGASTHFGPWQLAALQQEAARLARALARGEDVAPGPAPRDLRHLQLTLQTGVVLDSPPVWGRFGTVFEDAPERAAPGQTVRATFWGAHPKNDLRRQDSYLRVERQDAEGRWRLVATDDDWETRFLWRRALCWGCSLVGAEWQVPPDAPEGTYRLRVFGAAKGLGGVLTPYEGTSRPFRVEAPAPRVAAGAAVPPGGGAARPNGADGADGAAGAAVLAVPPPSGPQ